MMECLATVSEMNDLVFLFLKHRAEGILYPDYNEAVMVCFPCL